MVKPQDEAEVAALPMRGGHLQVCFESPEDAALQRKEFLPHQTMFVASEKTPPPFSECSLTIRFPGGEQFADIAARVVQVVPFGVQSGFVLQFLKPPSALEKALAAWLEGGNPETSESAEPEEVTVDETALEEEPPAEPSVEDVPAWKQRGSVKADTPGSRHDQIRALNPNERSRLAMRANKPERAILIRDHEPKVLLFLLKNPHITRGEVLDIARLRTINYQIVRTICGNPTWIQSEDLRFSLTINPKTPVGEALKLLHTLNMRNLRSIAKNHGIREQIKRTALRMVQERAG